MAGRLPIFGCETDLEAEPADPIPLPARGQVGVPGWLSDRQGRQLSYLRLSVTDRCDLRCTYCMPEDGVPASAKEDVLSFEEITRVVRVFARLGVKTVRFTGGEPLVRRSLPELIRMVRDEAGPLDLALTTNGTALAALAVPLSEAGLRRINVSVDSLDPTRFSAITRGGDLARVLAGVAAAREAGFAEIKINTVVVRGQNDGELRALVEWAWSLGAVPRFIELMPIGEGARLGRGAVVPVAEMLQSLAPLIDVAAAKEHHRLRGPAGYLYAKDGSGRRVGFIGAVTDNFCERCNRVRVTARGEIRACLASPTGFDLREHLRSGAGDDALVQALVEALWGKRQGHEFYVEGISRHHDVHMSRIGG